MSCNETKYPRKKRRNEPEPFDGFLSAKIINVPFFRPVSSRRFACNRKDAHQFGYLSYLMNSVSVCAFLENDRLTPLLKNLIVQSSLPLSPFKTMTAHLGGIAVGEWVGASLRGCNPAVQHFPGQVSCWQAVDPDLH
jgi:hypothetical protein